MFVPVLELEGTRDEIIAQLPDYDGQTLHVSVRVEEEPKPNPATALYAQPLSDAEAKRRLEIFQRIVARISEREPSKPDSRDLLREGRAGGMFGLEPTE